MEWTQARQAHAERTKHSVMESNRNGTVSNENMQGKMTTGRGPIETYKGSKKRFDASRAVPLSHLDYANNMIKHERAVERSIDRLGARRRLVEYNTILSKQTGGKPLTLGMKT